MPAVNPNVIAPQPLSQRAGPPTPAPMPSAPSPASMMMPVGSIGGPSTPTNDPQIAAASAQMARDKAIAARGPSQQAYMVQQQQAAQQAAMQQAQQLKQQALARTQASTQRANQQQAALANAAQARSLIGPVGKKMASGGKAQAYASGGTVRGGGCEMRGKTKGRMV